MEKKRIINKKHRKYDENFKQEALKMAKTRSVSEVARSLGIGENLLYKWRSDEKSKETPVETEINAEIEGLRKQLRQVEMERDILKKALVIFGRGT
jgi:transposase